MGQHRLVVIVPAYCEERTIADVVKQVRYHAEVIVVDDCSTDRTGERAQEAGAIVIRNTRNLGYDGTLNVGFETAGAAGFTHAITCDADGEHDPALVARYRDELIGNGIPLVLGVRPRKQRLAETIMGFMIRLRFGVNDILCGMKGFDMTLWRLNGGFDHHDSIGTELALQALKARVPFIQVPVGGVRRADRPRFDRRMRANMRIMKGLTGMLLRRDNPIARSLR